MLMNRAPLADLGDPTTPPPAAVDESGRIVETLHDGSPGAFAPVTSVREHGGFLWLGSLEQGAMGRIRAPPVR